jgi:polysaccharide pyruvyl transferase WcaK-like protein
VLRASREFVKRTPYLRGPYHRATFYWRARALAALWKDLPTSPVAKARPEVMVFGRYGGETVGNHFIQLGLLRALHQALPDRPVFLLSTNIDVTARGIAEVRDLVACRPGFADLSRFIAEKVSVVGEEKIRSLGPYDLLMLGGGPLTDDPILVKWLIWFQWARRANARTMMAGCGLSPLCNPMSVSLVKSLLAVTVVVLVRNRPSAAFERAANSSVELVLDPAFLCHPFLAPLVSAKRRWLAINGRALDFGCSPEREVAPAEVANSVVAHALALAGWATFDAVIPFSTLETGEVPDSAVSTSAADTLAGKLGIATLPLPPTTVLGLVDTLAKTEYLLSTRMHGFIVGLMLGCRSAHLDYIAGGGKGDQLYRQMLGRPSAPSLFRPGSASKDDYISLASLGEVQASIDGLVDRYASAIRQALRA